MPDAIIRLMPDPVLRLWTATMEVARRREVRRLVLALALLIAAAAYIRFMADIFRGDAYGYWESIRRNVLYVTALDTAPHGYLYSPAFIQALWPLFSLPWEIFYCIWLALLTVALLWIARPWLSLVIFAPIFLTFGISLLLVPRHSLASGNIYLFMGLAVVAGFRWPSTYAFLLLTKVTPGVGEGAHRAVAPGGDHEGAATRRGIQFLLDRQRPDGTWPEEATTGTGFPNVFYLTYGMYRDYFPLLALARA